MTRTILVLTLLCLAIPAYADETLSLASRPPAISGASNATVFAAMMEQLKMLQKDLRQNREQAKEDVRLATSARDRLNAAESVKIDEMRREAQERYNRAMQAAALAEQMGIIAGNLAISAGRMNQQQQTPVVQRPVTGVKPNPCPASNPNCLKLQGGLQPATSHVKGSPAKTRKLGLQPAGSGTSITAEPPQTAAPAPSGDGNGKP